MNQFENIRLKYVLKEPKKKEKKLIAVDDC